MAMRGPRQPIGSAPWIAEERSSALQIAQSEVEEFTFSAKNDVDWLNEHMAEIFSENQINVADVFKTPGKLRGKTPRTVRQANIAEVRVPLSDIFSATPKGLPNPFALANHAQIQPSKLRIAEDLLPAAHVERNQTSPRKVTAPAHVQQKTAKEVISFVDSGYHGSQSQEMMDIDDDDTVPLEQTCPVTAPSTAAEPTRCPAEDAAPSPTADERPSPTQPTVDPTFHSAREEQTATAKVFSPPTAFPPRKPVPGQVAAASSSPVRRAGPSSPPKLSPRKASPPQASPHRVPSPVKAAEPAPMPATEEVVAVPPVAPEAVEETEHDQTRSPSDGSSPIRPIVRKSSMNFASLPAREPLTSNKSLGARMSRVSHLDQTRTSYYNRQTGGKSLGNVRSETTEHERDEMDIDDDFTAQDTTDIEKNVAAHNKTYTQRLQDQISMLGKSNSSGPRPSKSLANLSNSQSNALAAVVQQSQASQPVQEPTTAAQASPKKQQPVVAPGAFPEDDDDWIAPPATEQKQSAAPSSQPLKRRSRSAGAAEEAAAKKAAAELEPAVPKQRLHNAVPASPARGPAALERVANVSGHVKSASVPSLPSLLENDAMSHKKAISVSNPTLATVPETDRPSTPSKSPTRNFVRDNPLKQVKNKLSSILKSSKGLLASSAAISAEGKSSLLSPSTTRLALFPGPSAESLAEKSSQGPEPAYPDLSQHLTADTNNTARPASPARSNSRRTRASTERERREQKQKEKETKEAQRLADQMGKLEKAREKEREKARVFSEEQERVAAMEKQLVAQKEQEVAAKPPPSPAKAPAKPTRTSPRKTKTQAEAESRADAASTENANEEADVEMGDAPASSMPPPPLPRPAAGPSQNTRTLRRPVKPTKEAPSKAKQAPTVIRVNTTSSQQSQFHPSNSILAATLHETLGPQQQQQQLKSKASSASLHHKPSLQSLKSSASSTGRPKALDLAAKRKEQEEREAQRKREAKAEMERKRAAQQEQEEQRRLEAQKQAAALTEAKKNAQRQAAIERAKQTRAPPPAPRPQPNGAPDFGLSRSEGGGLPRPASRMTTTMHRPQEELGRPVNAVLSNTGKAASKRALQQDGNDENARPGPDRNGGATYQAKDAKRIRMSEEFDEDELEVGGVHPNQSNIKGPPVRPSGGFKKELPNKSLFPSGYAPAPPSVTRDLFKATVTAQHNSQTKAGHPLDMAQVSKAAIPFASNPNPAGASSHKTPARPAGAQLASKSAAKSTAKSARSSPRFPNGDAIELPEIQTDDEDSDDDAQIGVAPWADSPDLRKALMRQETIDPLQVFGPPGPLNMEEVFNKSKDRWHKFRARTSSANWSGSDRLTEEDIRKDLAARDKMRREGGWTYELSKEVL